MNPMKTAPGRWLRAGSAAVLACASLSGCGGGGGGGATEGTAVLDTTAARSSSRKVVSQPANTKGRLLVSNCFQCHGTMVNGGFEEIRGESAKELIEFFDKPASRDIMAAHAQGYTAEQLRKVAAYLQQ